MKHWLRRAAFVIAALLLILTFVNASWLAPKPVGGVKLVAHRGVYQLYDHKDEKRDDCTTDRIEPPVHDYQENTVRSMQAAARIGADVVEIDIAPTADGRIAVFHDWIVDCRIRERFPKAWAFSKERMKRCTKEYAIYGWTGIVPESCRNGTMMVPLNYQWVFWGWPNRLIQRMESVGARVVVIGPRGGRAGDGLTLPEQLGDIPASFSGYLWVEDIWTVGPALRPARDFRSQAQIDAAEAGLRRRREKME